MTFTHISLNNSAKANMPTWEDFKKRHILNPDLHRGYESWDKTDQNTWLRNRLTGFPGRGGYGNKQLNSVVIARSSEILSDFQNPGVKYKNEQDFYWSNRKYPIWLFKKQGQEYSVDKLNERHGPMHFLARTSPQDGYKPIHFHAQAPQPSDNPPRY